MRNILKATTLESKFPLLAVEGGCIISKDADITVAYRVELPELFTVTSAEYEAIHAAWCKALKVLPEYSVVHKQDWKPAVSSAVAYGQMHLNCIKLPRQGSPPERGSLNREGKTIVVSIRRRGSLA